MHRLARLLLAAAVVALALPAWGRRGKAIFAPEASPSEEIAALWDALEDAEIGMRHTALLARDVSFTDGESTWHLDQGFVFRFYTSTPSREDVTVGFAFVGEGRQEVRFQDPRDGQRFANHMVIRAGWDADELRDVAEGYPFTVPVSKGIVLSADPAVREFLKTLPQIGGGARGEAMESEAIVVLDTRQSLDDDIREAERMLTRRLVELRDANFWPRRLLARELLLQERGAFSPARSLLLADFRTTERFMVEDQFSRLMPSFQDRWLTHLRDGSGEIDARLRSKLFIFGGEELATVRFNAAEDMSDGSVFRGDSADLDATSATSPSGGIGSGPTASSGSQDVQAVDPVLPDPTAEISEALDSSGMLMVAGQRFPPSDPYDRFSPPLPAVRPEPVHARLGARAVARWNRHTVDIEIDSYLEIAARGGPISSFVIRVPREELLVGSWAVTAVEGPDGFPLDFVRLDQERTVFDRAPFAELLIVLDEPLAEDRSARIRVAWRDNWNLSNMSGERSGLQRALGSSTGLHRVIPQLGPYDDNTPWTYNISVRLPEEARQSAAITGRLIRNETDGDWRILESGGGPTAWAGFSIGEWESRDEPPAFGMPGIRVNLLRKDLYYLEKFAPLLRQELAFFEAILPPLGRSDLELFQDADRGFAPRHQFTRAMPDNRGSSGRFTTGAAPDGVLAMSKLRLGSTGTYETRLRNAFPEMESVDLAAQLARQWWGGKVRVLHDRDHWLVDTLSEAYGLFYLQGAFESEVLYTRLETTRDIWDRANPPLGSMSLTDAPSSRWAAPALLNYGPYVIAWTLRDSIGEDRMLEALHAFQREYAGSAVTTEHLLVFLKQHTGVDLDDFFNFWIYGGWLPDLQLTYAVEEAEGSPLLTLELSSGVPFGSLVVPMRVTDGDGHALDLTVLVEDGSARQAIDLDGLTGDVREIELLMDPAFTVLTRDRGVERLSPERMARRLGED